jgi:hypothetical protein
MVSYTIPRRIKVREIVAYGLNGKQMIYLACGLGAGGGILALPLPLEVKIAGSIMTTVGSIFLSLAKRHGQDLDKYVWNTVVYPLRQKEWNDDVQTEKGSIKVRIKGQSSSA